MIQFPRWATVLFWLASVIVGAAIVTDLAETTQGDKFLAAAQMILATLLAQSRAVAGVPVPVGDTTTLTITKAPVPEPLPLPPVEK